MKISLACDRQKTKRLLQFALSIVLMFLYACGSEPETTSDTGTIAFSVTFKGAPTEELVRHAAQLDCFGAGVDEVEGKVYDENDDYLASDAWECEDHQGTIEGVLAGENRKVVILGRDLDLEVDENIIYRGENSPITVIAGQTTEPIEITAEPCIPTLMSPSDGAILSTSNPPFEWSAITGTQEYQIQISTEDSFTSMVIEDTVQFNSYEPVTPLSDGTYYWRVNAIDTYGNKSGWSEVWSFTVTAKLQYSGWYDTNGSARGVHISGNYAYVADYDNGLQVIDISDPTNPTWAGEYIITGNAYDVFVSGSYAFVAYGTVGGLQIVDISTPTNPTWVGDFDTDGSAQGVYVSGDYAYVADESNGLEVIDISDPTNPTWAWQFIIMPGNAYDIFISGPYAYVAYGTVGGLQILDISTSTWVGGFDTDGSAHGVFVSGNYAYVADDSNGLQVIDITDPENPAFEGSYIALSSSQGIYVSGNYAYVADYDNGLQVINIFDPTDPIWVEGYITTGHAYGVYISGSYAYVAYGTDSGLQVLSIQ